MGLVIEYQHLGGHWEYPRTDRPNRAVRADRADWRCFDSYWTNRPYWRYWGCRFYWAYWPDWRYWCDWCYWTYRRHGRDWTDWPGWR